MHAMGGTHPQGRHGGNTAEPRILLITPPAPTADTWRRLETLLTALPTGSLTLQLRLPQATTRTLLSHAANLQRQCAACGVPLLVNRRIDVALAVGADGVQLPENALPVPEARRLLAADARIGRSCHDLRGLSAAARGGADFATLSPFAPTAGKSPPLARSAFRTACMDSSIPVYALGGIHAGNAAAAIEAGAHGVAVISAIFAAENPKAALQALHAAVR
ncbi:MAG: thiamine phosphate synthase [Polyangiales bacterium]